MRLLRILGAVLLSSWIVGLLQWSAYALGLTCMAAVLGGSSTGGDAAFVFYEVFGLLWLVGPWLCLAFVLYATGRRRPATARAFKKSLKAVAALTMILLVVLRVRHSQDGFGEGVLGFLLNSGFAIAWTVDFAAMLMILADQLLMLVRSLWGLTNAVRGALVAVRGQRARA